MGRIWLWNSRQNFKNYWFKSVFINRNCLLYIIIDRTATISVCLCKVHWNNFDNNNVIMGCNSTNFFSNQKLFSGTWLNLGKSKNFVIFCLLKVIRSYFFDLTDCFFGLEIVCFQKNFAVTFPEYLLKSPITFTQNYHKF